MITDFFPPRRRTLSNNDPTERYQALRGFEINQCLKWTILETPCYLIRETIIVIFLLIVKPEERKGNEVIWEAWFSTAVIEAVKTMQEAWAWSFPNLTSEDTLEAMKGRLSILMMAESCKIEHWNISKHQKALDLTMTVFNCVTSINYFELKGLVWVFCFCFFLTKGFIWI